VSYLPRLCSILATKQGEGEGEGEGESVGDGDGGKWMMNL
jgi:hypothetical protein